MKISKFALLFILATFLKPTAGFACGPLSLSVGTPTYSFNSGGVATLQVTVTRNAPYTDCDFFIGFTRGSANSYTPRTLKNGSNSIPYNFYRNVWLKRILRSVPDSDKNRHFLRGSFPNGSPFLKRVLTYRLAIGNIPPSPAVGLYSDVVNLRLYEGEPDDNDYDLEDVESVTTTYNVPHVAHVSLVNTGAAFDQNDTSQTINFGVLSAGQKLGFDVVTVYNSGYKLTISSANNGKLKHTSQNQFVPYTFSVNSVPLNLSNSLSTPAIIGTGSGKSPPAGHRFAITVQVGAVSTLAGNYTDTSVIEISAP